LVIISVVSDITTLAVIPIAVPPGAAFKVERGDIVLVEEEVGNATG